MENELGCDEVWEVVLMAAERGWKINLHFKNEDKFDNALITQIDEEKRAFIVERIGERHLKPSLIFNRDLASAKLHW
jgi:hypothetical protein